MASLLALLPSAVVLVAVLGLRWSGLAAAAAAVAASAGLWLAGIFIAPAEAQIFRALADAGVLTLLVAAMIVPGILFVEATRDSRAPEAIAAVIQSLRLNTARAAILVAIGFGVLIESLTGMGVSLLVTVPLLLRIVDRPTAIALGLVSMSMMPWGALAISAQVGAKLAGLQLPELAAAVTRVSGGVAACLPLLAVSITKSQKLADYVIALVAGAVVLATITMTTSWIGIEAAGVISGLSVIMLMIGLAECRTGLGASLRAPGLRSYLCLIGVVMLQKLCIGWLAARGVAPVIATERVNFAVLTSPGIALMIATLLTASGSIHSGTFATVGKRAWRPIVSIALFMIAARLLIECGAIAELARLLSGLGRSGGVVAVVLLGSLSGFATGSGVTGNALFMPSAAAVGAGFGQVPLFAALQNGAAGHMGIAALPVAALLLSALPNRQAGEDTYVMRIGLLLAGWHAMILIAAGLMQVAR